MAGDDSTISTDWRIVDAVDDEWASETLPDDAVQLGPDMVPPADDAEDGDDGEDIEDEENKWKELGLQNAG